MKTQQLRRGFSLPVLRTSTTFFYGGSTTWRSWLLTAGPSGLVGALLYSANDPPVVAILIAVASDLFTVWQSE